MFRGSYTAGSVAFLLLSTTLPAFCLRIFPCTARKFTAGRTALAPGLLHTKPPRLPAMETGAVRLLYGYFFQALTQNLVRGLLVSPAYAGKRRVEKTPCLWYTDHPRVCGEKVSGGNRHQEGLGSPPRMRGKVVGSKELPGVVGITPAYAGKGPPDACRQPYA